jgi:hypothetical protein
MHVAKDHLQHLGRVVGNGHCVALVQRTSGVGHTSTWRRGPQVRGGSVAAGTVIATFGPTGRYENDTGGRSHAAIFLAEAADGLRVLDQWVGQPARERLIRFRGGQGQPVNDGDSYFVVVTA